MNVQVLWINKLLKALLDGVRLRKSATNVNIS